MCQQKCVGETKIVTGTVFHSSIMVTLFQKEQMFTRRAFSGTSTFLAFSGKSKEDHSIRRRNSSDLNSFLEIFTMKYKQTLWWLWYSQFRVLLLSREHLWLAVGRLGKWFLVSNCFFHTFHFVSSAQRQSHIFDSLLVKVEKQFPPLRWWPIIVCSCELGWHTSLNMSNFTNMDVTALVV